MKGCSGLGLIAVGLSFILMFFALVSVQAEEVQRPAWLSDEVIAAAMRIDMSEAQMGPFRENVRVFLEDFRAEVQRIIRRGGADLENTVRRARSKLAHEMDERMAEILSEEQMPRYQEYRELLIEAVMSGR